MNKDSLASSKGVEPSAKTQRAVRRLVKAQGEFSTANAIGISKQTLARVASGMSVNKTTLAVVEAYVAKGAVA